MNDLTPPSEPVADTRVSNTLTNLGLSRAQNAARAGKITASFVPYLMAGDDAKILREWQRLIEAPEYAPEDLSAVWPVQFGSYIEPFALDWHERSTGHALTMRGEVVIHPDMPHVSCTLDAYRAHDQTVIDCKAPGKWRKLEDVLAFYPAQLVVQKWCVKAQRAALLVVHGGAEPEEHTLQWGADYERQVQDRIEWFYSCVCDLSCPVAVAPIAAPVAATKIVDMASSNAWAEWAPKWTANKAAAKTFEAAQKELKSLVAPDVSKAFGHGITVSRAKNGAITIKDLA